MMKMSNFENPTWRTAAILKIVITPYLSRESSKLTKSGMQTQILSKATETRQKFRNSQFKMADGRHTENHFLAITRPHIVRLRPKLEWGGIVARTRRLDDENVKFRKSNMADGRHFENHYISISQPQLVRISRNLVCGHKFYRRRRKRQKIRNSLIQNGGWTRH